MPTLPAHPNLEQLRHQAKDLLRAAQGGDRQALERVHRASDRLTLSAAQSALARDYGFSSWPRLKAEVESRALDLAGKVEEFHQASVRGSVDRAAQLLAATPEIAGYDVTTALMLGDVARVREELGCAVASTNTGPGNEEIIELLLERGARVEDQDLYLAAFADDAPRCVRLLVDHTPDITEIARTAIGGPIGTGDAEALRLMLEAGADPGCYVSDEDHPGAAVYDAIAAERSAEFVELLLAHGADPRAPGPDGRSPYRLATAAGRRDLADLLRRYGAAEDATDGDRLLAACLVGDRAEAERRVAGDPRLIDGLDDAQRGMIVRACEAGNTEAVRLMLDLGFPLDARDGNFGGTPLHAAAHSGSAGTVRLLLERGADLEARDGTWESPALGWAVVGSGERPEDNPAADWIATIRALLDAGASTESISLAPDDPKPPSAEVAALLHEYGVGRR